MYYVIFLYENKISNNILLKYFLCINLSRIITATLSNVLLFHILYFFVMFIRERLTNLSTFTFVIVFILKQKTITESSKTFKAS